VLAKSKAAITLTSDSETAMQPQTLSSKNA